ncbi:hypothetical protein NIES23_32880 [Trichormus variabilis NIES-23]|uniref:Uncharacterized protein n=1 Tax=Trichormus variabilis NIES-23 TaxID=1973479 RepID=A0A1Z4KNG7_ANAVA|nr:hypothetical protein NIES23_32880 [Trichormus variabilis NIES-23]
MLAIFTVIILYYLFGKNNQVVIAASAEKYLGAMTA